jgi:hypothetical protein
VVSEVVATLGTALAVSACGTDVTGTAETAEFDGNAAADDLAQGPAGLYSRQGRPDPPGVLAGFVEGFTPGR